MPDFIPRSDSKFAIWAKNFVTGVQANYSSLGISESQVEELQVSWEAFRSSYSITQSPSTRTSPAIIIKDENRAKLIKVVRVIAGIIRTRPGISNDMLIQLGLNVPSQRVKNLSAPDVTPYIAAKAVGDQSIEISFLDRKPARATSAIIYVSLGDRFPKGEKDWTMHSVQSRTRFVIHFNEYLTPGQMVWICANWISARAKKGPDSNVVSLRLAGGYEGPPMVQVAA